MFTFESAVKLKKSFERITYKESIILYAHEDFISVHIVYDNLKSRAYFYKYEVFKKPDTLYLGLNNDRLQYAYLQDCFNFSIKFIDIDKTCFSQYEHYLASCKFLNNYQISTKLFHLFRWNPKLLRNLIDANCLNNFNKLNFDNYIGINKSKVYIKDAFGLSAKYVKLIFSEDCINNKYFYTKILHDANFSLEEIETFFNFLRENRYIAPVINGCVNKRVIHKFYDLANSGPDKILLYRDYLYMYYYSERVFGSSFIKNYPLVPENITKWHCKLMQGVVTGYKSSDTAKYQDVYVNNVLNLVIPYEYSDSEYSIIACKDLSDLVKEGSELKHCVGSYAESVSLGNEYILFLRKNNDLNTPYFTIDITPDKKVRQIHGKCNCDITDEIKPFIKKWMDKFSLTWEGDNSRKMHL